MGTIHKLPTAADKQTRLLKKMVSDMIAQHPDPEVAKRWSAMAQETLSRYPGPPAPTQPLLDLDSIDGFTKAQSDAIHTIAQAWLHGYFDDVRDQLMNVHKDMLTLQKRVAELEAGRQ